MRLLYTTSLLLMLFFMKFVGAQDMIGLHTDNYAGVYSLNYNPAEIVDSRYKIHVNLFSVNSTFSSDFLGFKRDVFFGKDMSFFTKGKKWTEILSAEYGLMAQKNSYDKRRLYFNIDVSAAPSFMWSFGQNRHHSFAFTYRTRMLMNTTGIMSDLLVLAYNENAVLRNDKQKAPATSLLQASLWNEYALTYGTTIFKRKSSNITAAITFKVNQGIAGTYINFKKPNTIEYREPSNINKESFVKINSQVDFGYSKAFGQGLKKTSINDWFLGKDLGFGADIGFVWERRTAEGSIADELDSTPKNIDNSIEKYKYKIGLSVMDIGFIPYTTYPNDNKSFVINASLPIGDYAKGASRFLVDDTNLFGFDLVFTNASDAGGVSPKKSSFQMILPTRINLSLDYLVRPRIYANVSATYALSLTSVKMGMLSEVAITPRYETKKISVFMPFSANLNWNMNLGVGVRYGPIIFGVKDILPFVFVRECMFGNNVYVGVSIPIFKKVKDKDGDHVIDKLDKCVDVPGSVENEGCPEKEEGDKDEDGILDKEDKCPEVSGILELKGCPDSDGDGISDEEDKCPFDMGSAAFEGCPDKDKDGIGDHEDACPDIYGIKRFKGCRDTDRDGVGDNEDECLLLPGIKKLLGCPDENKDGIADTKDTEVFPDKERKRFKALGDTDKDGIPDTEDDCILRKGLPEYNGCPKPLANKIKSPSKHQEISTNLGKSISFNPDRYTIDVSVFPNIQPAADFLKANPNYILNLEIHTDSVGKESSNMLLSRRRANFLRSLFLMKGISPSRIIAKAFGETRPIASNKTKKGREINRRIIFHFSSKKNK